ncbi:type IV secretory system conjugative DNA transfer family protein [Candidatus Vampirococcus lugosii]|uniref:Type IV secretion system coupling protein TraD DNA-binding domain-containing protein n=1 Tax=Candidatus Vampirococcus lugosii TaxID=2789015 RepID=A0ABS5QMI9_9BACT|nr:type IV secretory system conjugative DNA transfer family protein [Candidatus Vampirococcus lugosii]MBS8122431.1 hypothetical protein [Candidatus Vampirococcus lugosii]
MEKKKCEQFLIDYIESKSFNEDEPVGSIAKNVWGENISNCYRHFGGSSGISDFINNLKSNNNYHYSAEEEGISNDKGEGKGTSVGKIYDELNGENQENGEFQENQEQEVGQFDSIIDTSLFALKIIGIGLLGIILIIFIWKLFKYLFAFLYDVLNIRRIQYLRVIIPRGDSREEREMQKEIAKDMHEKIARMGQVFRNIHKLGELSVRDIIMNYVFSKPKVSFALHYKDGQLQLLFAVYPEYKNILEGAITAQYSDASVETIKIPHFFAKTYYDIIPIHPEKDPVYPIRIFKQLEDDPLNNVLDAIGKISNEDTFTIFTTIKPAGSSFNIKAQNFANALYKKDESVTLSTPLWKKLVFPWKFFDFLIHGPSDGLVKKFSNNDSQGDPIIRMVKSEEDALNAMGEEAGKPAFISGMMLITSSDYKDRLGANLQTVVSALTIYKDEYNNGLNQPEIMHDIFGFIFKPLWKFAIFFHLPNFFYKKNIFTVNELAGFFHIPDGLFNRSPIIKWMDYKALPAPDNLPKMEKPNNFFITGKVAEEYLDGNISKIFKGVRHWAVGKKKTKKEKLVPIENYKKNELFDKEIITKNGKDYVKETVNVLQTGLRVFKDGTLLGVNVYRNRFTPIYMRKKDRSRHHYIIGKSGGGKSVYIASMARQDVWNGDGLCVIDPHGDLVEDIMEYIPKERAKDVIYFDAGNEERPMGLNLYEIDNQDQADRVVNDATEIFMKMFGPEIFGPRIQEYFKYASLTLLEDMEEGASLIDVPRLFTDETFREYKIKKVKNPVVKNFWDKTYNAMGDREKQEIIPYFTSKFVNFITNRLIRNIIGQTKSAINFRKAMDEGKILLVNLSKGKLGEMNAQLLGMILVSQINNAAMSRADIPEDQRRDFFLYVDEFQNFVTDTFADILSEARKYHLALIMAHQYIGQLEGSNGGMGDSGGVKDAVFGNVGTMQSFKIGAPDAEALEKEYAPVLSPQDIVGISNFKVYIKLNISNASSRVFSMNTIWTEDYKNPKVAEILKEYCSKKYGRKRQFVDAEISARLGILND